MIADVGVPPQALAATAADGDAQAAGGKTGDER